MSSGSNYYTSCDLVCGYNCVGEGDAGGDEVSPEEKEEVFAHGHIRTERVARTLVLNLSFVN
jgi:hypothetical protein